MDAECVSKFDEPFPYWNAKDKVCAPLSTHHLGNIVLSLQLLHVAL